MVVGRVLRSRGPRVAVIHPTFDNIPDLLTDRVGLVPVSERELMDGDLAAAERRGASAVWVTTPNNQRDGYWTGPILPTSPRKRPEDG